MTRLPGVVNVDPEALVRYGALAHEFGDDMATIRTPEVVAHPEQTTATAVAAMHAQVESTTAGYAAAARFYGTSTQLAAAVYVATDDGNADLIDGVL